MRENLLGDHRNRNGFRDFREVVVMAGIARSFRDEPARDRSFSVEARDLLCLTYRQCTPRAATPVDSMSLQSATVSSMVGSKRILQVMGISGKLVTSVVRIYITVEWQVIEECKCRKPP